MRTLYDILQTAKDGQRPTEDECYYSMLVLNGTLNLTMGNLDQMADAKTDAARKVLTDACHRLYSSALDADLRAYLGNDVPGNPDYDRFRASGKRLLDQIMQQSQ